MQLSLMAKLCGENRIRVEVVGEEGECLLSPEVAQRLQMEPAHSKLKLETMVAVFVHTLSDPK